MGQYADTSHFQDWLLATDLSTLRRINMKRSLQPSSLIVALLFLAGCLTPVKNEMPLAKDDLSTMPADTNHTKLVIFNDSAFMSYGLDGSGRINVTINGKGLGQIKVGRYAQVIVPKGKCQVDLMHRGMSDCFSQYDFEFSGSESFLEIAATPFSNEANCVSALPKDFEKKYMPIK
jgi:hypothetical protein